MFVEYFGKLIDNLILSCCKIWWVQINFTILHRVLTSCFLSGRFAQLQKYFR